MTPELIYCAGGNRRFAKIAVAHGFTYGAQLPCTTYLPVEFADQDWKRPSFEVYMAALEQHRPRMATVLDWEREDQLPDVLRWAETAARFVTETLIIIPKVMSGIDRLPRTIGGREVRLGYSVPTRFGATSVPSWEFANWPVHLLGGSPHRQHALARYMRVASADGNYSQRQAVKSCQFFAAARLDAGTNRHFPYLREVAISAREWAEDVPYLAFNLSCINIRLLWAFGPITTIRYGLEEDIPAIQRIARQYRAELGYVMAPALRESINRHSLYVASTPAGIVQGFVNSRTRRDGVNVVYEIAVDRLWRGQRIGAALLMAVTSPRRLKVTTDNQTAIAFYEGAGMTQTAQEAGRNRPLFVYEMGV